MMIWWKRQFLEVPLKKKMMSQHQENRNFPITILGDAKNPYTP